ncbi:pseudaminic acid cytidylyltransferase [Rheinheimera maricola]|uniref:Pseudaminic acid cytidylyltransferase n=1 Tax=Rheinheimera maricola TaxID=2793282 RepID=A0ABS7X3T0_9GAMM|nr:pseudaminic acid cytidylyltransferase [Rheinheimera maricola]MBZ9610218.1 pseudaminic acid cytidylyltransferase [Rheinheimera maricola]
MRIAVIPARGGSKRIPNKNIKLFCGKPIIAYSIAAAHESGLFDKIIVSTDSENIADVAIQYGAQVPFLRPAELADDYASARVAVHHTREMLERQGLTISYTCCIYATAPFVQAASIVDGFNKLANSEKKYCFSVAQFDYSPFRGIVFSSGKAELLFPQHRHSRSQDMPAVYHDAAQFYWSKIQHPVIDEPLVGADFEPIIIPSMLVQDIDTAEDWTQAELKYQLLQQHRAVT